jgi:hypothetical protein
MNRSFLVSFFLAAVVTTGFAQTGHVGYTWSGPVAALNEELPNAACTTTFPQMLGYTPIGAGFGLTAGTILGGYALDQDHDLVYASDGFFIFVAANFLYAPSPCGGGPVPGTVFPVPFAITSSGAAFGLVTGMAVGHDAWTTSPSFPCTDILFLTNGTDIMGIDPRPPYAVVVPPFLAAGVIAGNSLTGLEYEDTTTPGLDFIWATDNAGNTYIYDTLGNLAGGPLPVIGPPPASIIVGNVFDRSTCPPGHWVTDGFSMYPSVFANPTIALNWNPAIGLAFGASASAEPVLMAGRCGSTCNPFPVITTDHPIVGSTPITFSLSGAPPLTTAVFALDFVCTTGLGIFGCTWWLPPTFAWPITVTTATNGFGMASAGAFPTPVAQCPGLVGLTGYAQWFYLDGCSTSGFGMTDAMHIRLSTY